MDRQLEDADWGRLQQLDPAVLLPPEHARFGPLIRDGLQHFLQHLPAARRAVIPAPPEPGDGPIALSAWLVVVAGHCPVLHKLAQVLARDRRLGATLRGRLQALESMVPVSCAVAVRQVLEQELGDPAIHGLRLEDRPLAEASVAVVWPFEHPAGEGVFKILKPHIEQRLDEDLQAWSALGALLDQRCLELNLPPLDYGETFDMVRHLLRSEVRLDLEQVHLREASGLYADDDRVDIPELLPWSTPRVTAMSRLHGSKITAAGAAQRRLAHVVIEALVARPVWSERDAVLFHGDPHAGNLLHTAEGRLGILDWSLAGHLQRHHLQNIAQILLAGLQINAAGILQACRALAVQEVDDRALRGVVDAALRRVRWGEPPGVDWLVRLLDQAVLEARLRLDEHLLLFRKSLLILEGVAADLDERCSFDGVVVQSAWLQLLREGPRRLWSAPHNSDFGTRVSNLDLMRLACSGPLAALRCWSGWLQDWTTVGGR